jgi:hypothetical protein
LLHEQLEKLLLQENALTMRRRAESKLDISLVLTYFHD